MRQTGCTQRRASHLYLAVGLSLTAVLVSCTSRVSGPDKSGVDPCTVVTPYTLGATTDGRLATNDCQLADGSYIDYYSTTLTGGWYQFDMTAGFSTYLVLRTADRTAIGVHDDVGHGANTMLKALLPAGSYILDANAYPGSSGAYTLSSALTTTAVTNCEVVFVAKGTSTTQSLETTDCNAGTSYSDDYIIYIASNQSITVTLSSSAFDAYLELYGVPGRVAVNDNYSSTGTDARLTFTSPVGDFFVLRAESAAGFVTGAYTIDIQ